MDVVPGFQTTMDFVFEVNPDKINGLTVELWRGEIVVGYHQRVQVPLRITAGNAAQWRAAAQRPITEPQVNSCSASVLADPSFLLRRPGSLQDDWACIGTLPRPCKTPRSGFKRLQIAIDRPQRACRIGVGATSALIYVYSQSGRSPWDRSVRKPSAACSSLTTPFAREVWAAHV
jgi:hypothetical protein